MIGVIDYKAGNAPSVLNALNRLGVSASLVSSKSEIMKAEGIILPGVGSAIETINSLKELGCLDVLHDRVLKEGVPFLGICIGLQVLFEHSEEGDTECLGWIPGRVKRFSDEKVRVPQIGWNEVKFTREHDILSGLNNSEHFYFVNSYYVIPKDESVILATTEYDIEFCSMIAHKNIFAAQFHLEKSGVVGLKLLKNFAVMAGGATCLQRD